VRAVASLAFGLAFLLGIYLAFIGGWPIVAIGLASLAAAYAYSGGPQPISHTPYGELFVWFFSACLRSPAATGCRPSAFPPLRCSRAPRWGCPPPRCCCGVALRLLASRQGVHTARYWHHVFRLPDNRRPALRFRRRPPRRFPWVGTVAVHLFTVGVMGTILLAMIVRISKGLPAASSCSNRPTKRRCGS
jgi:hypothetical protein